MNRQIHRAILVLLIVVTSASAQTTEQDFIIRNFRFQDGQTLPEVRIHYRTMGTPVRGPDGAIRNGVLILHGSSGDATQVLAESFAGPLFAAGQPLDPAKYFLIFPDSLGNGK